MEKINYRKHDSNSSRGPGSALDELIKIDSKAFLESYEDSEGNQYWDITTKPELIDQIRTALIDGEVVFGIKIQFITQSQAPVECVTCDMATASVGNQCRFCAGQL